MKEYAIEQRQFNEETFGHDTRNIGKVVEMMNSYARDGWVLHTMVSVPTKDARTQLTTMVFERDVPDPKPLFGKEPERPEIKLEISKPVSKPWTCPECGYENSSLRTVCGKCNAKRQE